MRLPLLLIAAALLSTSYATTFFDQIPHLTSFVFTPLQFAPSIVTSDSRYYNERVASSTFPLHTEVSKMSNINLDTKTIRSEQTSSTTTVSLSGEFSAYHPTDQVWMCYYSTFHIHNTPLPSEPKFTYSTHAPLTNPPTPITIPSAFVPTFLSCCPTVYSPFPQHPSWPHEHSTTPITQHNFDLILTPPFFANLQRAGCGHTHVLDHDNITTGSQEDQYPRQLFLENYRNTPDSWYYSTKPVNNKSTTYTYTRFQIAQNISSEILKPINYSKPTSTLANSSTNSGEVWKFGISTLMKCDKKYIAHLGEGFRRGIGLSYDLSTCSAVQSPHRHPTSSPPNTSAQVHNDANNKCQTILLNYIPTPLFIDPYQITYAIIAEHNQKQKEQGESKHSNINTTSQVRSLQISDFDWYLYNFSDVEAQTNNGGGNFLAMAISQDTFDHKRAQPFHLRFPIYQRYSAAQLSTDSFSLPHFMHNALNPTNLNELRYSTEFYEPIVISHCVPRSTLTSQQSKLPSISTLMSLVRENDHTIAQLNNINLTAPVGTLNVLPAMTFVSLIILIATGIVIYKIFSIQLKQTQ